MLTIAPIKSVNSTINKVSFKSGVQSNYGANVINNTSVKNEGSFVTDFLGTLKQSPLFFETFIKRQQSIEKGLESTDKNKINAIA